MKSIFIVAVLLVSASFASGFYIAESGHKEKRVYIYVDRPVYQAVNTDHSKQYLVKQVDMLAAAIPASALRGMK